MRAVAPFVLFLLLLGWPAAGYPQSDASPPAPPVFYETTTVTARPVSSASGAVTVVGPAEAQVSGARSATELLQEVPGLELLSSGGRAGQTNAYIRGGDPNFTLVLLDGIPLNDATDLQGGAVNLEELPAGLVERAEIVRGPLTAFYGTSSLSGVVQLFTPRGGPGPLRASVGAEAGNAELRRGFARAAGPAGERGGVSGGLSWDQERHRIAEDRFRQFDAWGSASVALGRTADLRLTGRFADGEANDYPDASGGPVYGSGELRHATHEDLALGAQVDLGDPAGRRHHLSLGFSRRERDRSSPAVPPQVPASNEQVTFTRLRLAWQVPLHRTSRTELDAGASVDEERGENASVLELPPFLGGDVPGDYRKTRWSGGVFAGARRELALGRGRGAVTFEAALRADFASTDSPQLNPHAGVVVRPGGGATRLRVSAGRASKLPSFFALASPRALGGNPDLRPESAWGGEAGIEHELRGGAARSGRLVLPPAVRGPGGLRLRAVPPREPLARARAGRRAHRPLAAPPRPRPRRRGDVPRRGGPGRRRPPHEPAGREATGHVAARRAAEPAAAGESRRRAPTDEQIPVPGRDTVDGYGLARPRRVVARARRVDPARPPRQPGRPSYETLIGFPGPGRSFWVGVGWDRS